MSSQQQPPHPDPSAYPPYNAPQQQPQQYQQQNPNPPYGPSDAYPYATGSPPPPTGNAPLLRFDERTGRYEEPDLNSQAQWGGDAHGAGTGGQGGYGGGAGGRRDEEDVPPGLPPRRTDTSAALPQGADRSHQVEVMQSYEMSRPQTEDEQNQAILQREFPKLDSSLIAAIYGDSGSLSATREMLQELSSGGD